MWNFGTRINHIRYGIDNQTYLFKLAFTSIENIHHLLCSTLCSVFEDFLIIKVLIYFISSIFAHLQQRNFAQLNKRLQNWDHNLSKNNPLKITPDMTRVVKKLYYKDWDKNTIEAFYLNPLK